MIPEELATGASNQKEVSVDIGQIKLRMYQGDITLANVDVIINGTNNEMDLSLGNLSYSNCLQLQNKVSIFILVI